MRINIYNSCGRPFRKLTPLGLCEQLHFEAFCQLLPGRPGEGQVSTQTSTKKAQGGSWSRSNGFTFSLTCPFHTCVRKGLLDPQTCPCQAFSLLDYLRLPLIRPFLLLVLCQKSNPRKKKKKNTQHNIAEYQSAFFDLIYQIHE